MTRRIIPTAAVVALLASTSLLATPTAAHAAGSGLTVTSGITTKDLTASGGAAGLAAALMGPGVTVSNASFTGAGAQAGLVSISDPAVVGFNSGVIMSSGNIADIVGPNTSESTTGDMAGGQDTDLTALISSTQTVYPMTYDAAVLEFDFVPNASTVYFTYVFSSEEYIEWVNLFNDVFAFWVTKPGGAPSNCALAGDGTPVSIDAINDTVNPAQFRSNSLYFPGMTPNPLNIESDGISVELICSASVTSGQVNHMKLAIADTSDQILDSVVMIKSHSLSTQAPESCNNGGDDDADSQIDMSDSDCVASTSPAPTQTNQTLGTTVTFSGVGSNGNTAPFTGSEGSMIPLDATAIGLDAATLAAIGDAQVFVTHTGWVVTPKAGTTGTCSIQDANGNDLGTAHQALAPDGSAAVVYAVCTTDGEYTARVDAYDNEWVVGKGSATDTDVDFFVQNAPPTVELTAPANASTVGVGETMSVTATVSDPGADDTIVGCEVAFGDGTTVPGTLSSGTCSADHVYSALGLAKVSVAATDSDGDSGSAAVGVTVDAGSLTPQAIVATAPGSAIYGSSFTLSATGGASGQPLAFGSSGGCTNIGPSYTMTSGTQGCLVTIDQAGGAGYAPAPTYQVTVAAAPRPLTVSADPKSKTVGQADPALTYAVTSGSLVSGDTLTGSLTRIAGESVGTYPITQGTLAAGADYALTFVPSVLTIKALTPTITSIAPTSGGPGTSVTITGTNLGGVTAVAFNGKAAPFTALSATSVVTSVPVGATTGPISVTTSGGTATSGTFTASTTKKAPTVSSFSPTSGAAGTMITITGSNLAGATSVKVGSTTVATGWTVLSATQLQLPVPAGTTTGSVAVTTVGGTATTTSWFTVPGTPAPTSLAYSGSTSAKKGASITLKATLSSGSAKVAGVSVTFTVNGKTFTATTSSTGVASVTTTAPAVAGTYPITATFAGTTGYAASSASASLKVA